MITANQHPSYSCLAEMNKDAVIFPEFTPAFIGTAMNGKKSVACYDFNQCVIQLIGSEDQSHQKQKSFYF